MFDILDLISISEPVVRVESICQTLNYTRATTYRYLKALCDAGLLVPSGEGVYALGPRILELERLERLTNPLLRASQKVVSPLARRFPDSALLVCSLYRDRVLCIHQDGLDRFQVKGQDIPLLRSRGLALSLFSGAASLAILPFLPDYRIRSLYLTREREITEFGLSTSWQEFKACIAAIKRRGYVVSKGQVNVRLAAIAAPILATDGEVLGSFARILLREDLSRQDETRSAKEVMAIAREIASGLISETSEPRETAFAALD